MMIVSCDDRGKECMLKVGIGMHALLEKYCGYYKIHFKNAILIIPFKEFDFHKVHYQIIPNDY